MPPFKSRIGSEARGAADIFAARPTELWIGGLMFRSLVYGKSVEKFRAPVADLFLRFLNRKVVVADGLSIVSCVVEDH
jgi:hypothetical protein